MTEPITERRNSLTDNIDVASPIDIVHLLESCDRQIFGGYENSEGLLDKQILDKVNEISSLAAGILKNADNGVIVFSGCGTSGRIGFMTARTFGRQLRNEGRKSCYEYVIAGGDKALLTSQELYEDDPDHGAQTLAEVCAGKQQVLYIGITCGLSAPFVAGQLDYCLQHSDIYTPVLLGFNHLSQARNRTIEKWDKTFLQVAVRMEEASKEGKAFIVNPIIGPEPITGSSRMKGGSATKILLDVICTSAHMKAFSSHSTGHVTDLIQQYSSVIGCVYRETHHLSQLVQAGGHCLTDGGHIYYVGEDTCGILGLIDASECRPTYGAALDDVRGFVDGGFVTLGNKDGDLSHLGEEYHISVTDFYKDIRPSLTVNDLVIYCNPGNQCVFPSPAHTAVIRTISDTDTVHQKAEDVEMTVSIPVPPSICPCFQELLVKLVYNAVSTGAHVMKGKVLGNLMVDVRISNNKLYHRGIGIIQGNAGCSAKDAEGYLLQSIYSTDQLTPEQRSASITSHIQQASSLPKIVPVALIMAMTGCEVRQAKDRLTRSAIIRTAILQVKSDHKSTPTQSMS